MNHAYGQFCALNPTFCGDCSIIGHSLGSVITFDILTSQFQAVANSPTSEPSAPPHPEELDGERGREQSGEGVGPPVFPDPAAALYASQSYMTEGKNGKKIMAQQLVFQPKAFYAIGSPIGAHVNHVPVPYSIAIFY